MELLVVDGQGGRIGQQLVRGIVARHPKLQVFAVGTNSLATAAMLKAGADAGATGENPAIVGCRTADLIIGPLGIVIADSLLGEITPAMAAAIGQSRAKKILLPVNRCQHYVVGCRDLPLGELVRMAVELVRQFKEETL